MSVATGALLERASSACGPRDARLTVVVVTYHGAGFVEACLRSVAEACPGAEVLVVDNASGDDTVARVRREHPAVRVIELERNLGYGAAANVGVEAARGDFCLVLNQDLTLCSPLAPMLAAMRLTATHAAPAALEPAIDAGSA